MIKIKRVYDIAASEDGHRFLVDRLWPRGVKREGLNRVDWVKEAAPSNELRNQFHHDPARWEDFRRRYFAELDSIPDAWRPLLEAARTETVTLLYSARDTEHNNARALKEYLENHLAVG
jgi:uncharacterized protein YeaO (DUF488 family)